MSELLAKIKQMIGSDMLPSNFLRIRRDKSLRQLTDRELINLESEIGAKLFGPVPKGHRREFFCIDKTNWIWHEEWIDEKGKLKVATVRYEVREDGILKAQEGAKYSYIQGQELNNLVTAIRLYYEQVARHIYHRDPQTGQKLV